MNREKKLKKLIRVSNSMKEELAKLDEQINDCKTTIDLCEKEISVKSNNVKKQN